MNIPEIAVVVSGLDEEYPYNIIRGINQFVREHNMNVSYFAAFGGAVESRRFDMGEFSIYGLADFSRFDGAILLTNTFSDVDIRKRITDKVMDAGIPTVVFECRDYPEFYNLSIDNYTVMKKLVEHIIKVHGAKVINFVSGPLTNPEAMTRYEAFSDAMTENGLEIDKKRIFYGKFRSVDGLAAAEDFVRSELPLPDAFICANDSMALTLISALDRLGYKVPDDVIVTGFDNTFNARNCLPALTTVKRPLFYAGYSACRMLYDVLNGVELPKNTIVEASAVFSESCGCPLHFKESLKRFKQKVYRRSERTTSNINMLNRLTAGLADADTPERAYLVIADNIAALGCGKFSLCLVEGWEYFYNNPELDNSTLSYTDHITAPLIWEKGRLRSVERFKRRDLFPEPPENGKNINYFLPLHFGERYLGYYIITNGDFPISSLICNTFSLTIGNALENISRLEHIRKSMEVLNQLYVLDSLCCIYNRCGFMNIAGRRFNECTESKTPVMISFADMDGLKAINDTYGHSEGDKALKLLAAALRSCCGKNSICARIGGDEFAVFTVKATEETRETLESKIEHTLDDINKAADKPYKIMASIGSVIVTPSAEDTIEGLLNKADETMYEIKKQRKAERS
ncbi:MAG: GGDEF domain-containing protein [Ruminococcus sp.]|nr:GGDEF domain-containing protein [Ruminococcus sp.]